MMRCRAVVCKRASRYYYKASPGLVPSICRRIDGCSDQRISHAESRADENFTCKLVINLGDFHLAARETNLLVSKEKYVVGLSPTLFAWIAWKY